MGKILEEEKHIYAFKKLRGTGIPTVSRNLLTEHQARLVVHNLEHCANPHLSLLSKDRVKFAYYIPGREELKVLNASSNGKTQDLTDYCTPEEASE